jgi:hypothetical protein
METAGHEETRAYGNRSCGIRMGNSSRLRNGLRWDRRMEMQKGSSEVV